MDFFARELAVGSLRIPGRVLLAPLAGVTDIACRRICQEFGASLTYVEMLNAIAVKYAGRHMKKMMARHPAEPVLGIQVTGREPEDVAHAVGLVDAMDYDTIDINMGCPVRKVVHSGGGSALLKDVTKLGEMVALCRAKTAKPLTVKVRLGFTKDGVNIEAIATAIAAAGADMLTIHGRTRDCTYSDPIQFDAMKRGFEAARRAAVRPITLVGNGNVMSHARAVEMVERTGCDAVMISRGALGNPWIFREIISGHSIRPTAQEWLAVMLRHIALHSECHGEGITAARMMRKHLNWYSTGFPRSNRLRLRLNDINTLDDARALVTTFVEGLPPGYRRFDENQPAAHKGESYDPKFDMDRELDRGASLEPEPESPEVS